MHLTTRVTLAKSVALALVLWLVLLLETGNAASVPSGMRGTGLAGAPAGLVAAIDRSAQREAALDPAFRVDAQGCARLSAQHMTACFTPGGARFRTPRVALQLSLSAWGRPGRLTALALAPGRPHANRIEYRGSGIRAWWRVLPLGYEQGFTVERAPAGRGPVIIELRASRAPAIAGDSLAWGRLHYGQLVVTDARGRVLPATLTAVGRKLVLRFDAARARYPLNVDPLVWVEQEVTARDGAVGDNFGYSVAVSGSTALVGAPYHQVGSNANQGVAYVYTEANGVWSQTAELTASDGAGYDNFGYSVALDGATALVGAPYHQVGSNVRQGTAYVYTEANGVWSQTAELTASDGAAQDQFGWSVALNGTTALVGARYHKVGNNAYQGAAYVYTEANGVWSQMAELTASDGAGDDLFGWSVALNGATALVGALYHQVGSNNQQGAAYVYTEANGTWSQTAELTASDGAAYDHFGYSVAVSGPTALVGALYHQVGSNAHQGAAYVYTETTGVWSQTAELTASGGMTRDQFGWSVAVSGPTALVGAPYHYVNPNVYQGAAYVYTDTNGVWSQTVELTASDGGSNDTFGQAVALNGPTALVGAPQHQVGSTTLQGAAYVYTETNGAWSQTAELTASDGAGDDLFGYSVAFNGPTALVGALNHQVFSNSGQGTAYFFGSADLGLVLSTPVTVAPGADYTSQAILTNSSSTASPALSLLLPVPTGTNYVSSSATQGSCSQTAGSVACNLGSLAASGGRANASVTLQTTAAAGTALANNARLALSTPALSQTTTTTVAVTPAVTGLANASVTVGQSVPAASFTISGTGALTVTASSSNTTLLPNAGLSVSSGCNANGAQCTLSMTPAAGQTGTATVTVTAKDTYGQQGVGSFTLTVNSLPPSSSGGGGALGLWSLLGLLLALLLPIIRRRFRPGSNPAPGS